MKDIQGALYAQIKGHFPCDKRRTELICKLIVGLLKLTQSGLSKWSKALPGEQDLEAKYKQLQRFARYFRFSPRLYCKVIWQLYGQGKQVYLTLDRSEWKMRGKWVQVTMIGIAHQGMSVPLLWQVYNGQGNTAYSTRKALLHCFDQWIERKQNQHIWWVADREYVDHKLKLGSTWQRLVQRTAAAKDAVLHPIAQKRNTDSSQQEDQTPPAI